jgi:hypothetical protein
MVVPVDGIREVFGIVPTISDAQLCSTGMGDLQSIVGAIPLGYRNKRALLTECVAMHCANNVALEPPQFF